MDSLLIHLVALLLLGASRRLDLETLGITVLATLLTIFKKFLKIFLLGLNFLIIDSKISRDLWVYTSIYLYSTEHNT